MSAEDRLKEIRQKLEQIVVTEGEDRGVILVPDESPTIYDPELECQVYVYANFSPLGNALIELYELAKGSGDG